MTALPASTTMTLYSVPRSPFAARVRLAVHAGGLPVTLAWPPGDGGQSPAWLSINPIGKIPALRLEDGSVLAESDTIVEYLADRFPEAALRPASAEGRARARLLARIVDLYLFTPGYGLIHHLDPRARDQAAVDEALGQIARGLDQLEAYMSEDRYAVGDALSTADCALVTLLFYLEVFAQVFARPVLGAQHRKILGYWGRVRGDAAVQRVLGELSEALHAEAGQG